MMVVEERMNGVRGVSECSTFVGCVKSNGHFLETVEEEEGANENLGSFSVVDDDDGLRTYKRQKKRKRRAASSKETTTTTTTTNQFKEDDQKIKQPHDTAMQSNYSDQDGQCSADYVRHWRNVVLEHISQSLDMGEGTEGGIQSCIQDALASSFFSSPVVRKLHGASEKTAHTKEASSFHENRWKERTGVSSDGSQAEPNNQTDVRDTTQLCQSVFLNVLVSEKFALLCRLLCENFQGIKVDNFSDFGVINSRMREGTYGQAPIRFSADMQEIWRKFEKIGEEMISLAKGLSNMSRKSYLDQVGSIVNCNCRRVGNHEGINQTGSEQRDSSGLVTKKWCASLESDRQTRREQREFRGSKTMICRRCRVKTGEDDSLVCDSCEEIYHVSCIEPGVDEIPQSWHCANCVAIGVELPHENCVVCERLNVIRTQVHADGKGPIAEEIVCDSVEKFVSSKKSKICKLCGGGEENMRKMKQCEHRYCPNRFYHVGCLNVEQLEYHGPHWYCPSCLCTACLIDQDDDKIVLCDGCDHAYHTHCMEPPRSSIPEGKWFCKHCEAGIQALHKAKSAYENLDKRRRSTRSSGARDRAGGSVDMLLSAAEKLKSEEKSVVH